MIINYNIKLLKENERVKTELNKNLCPHSGNFLTRRIEYDGKPNTKGLIRACNGCYCFGYNAPET